MQALKGGRLQGQAAIVTGASSGIGAATARALVAEGASVALMSRRREQLDELAAELGSQAVAIPVDVARADEVASAVERAERELGGIDLAVNSAGVAWPVSLQSLDAAAWQQVIDINLSGSFYVAREAGLRMAAGRGGAIVNLSSEFAVRAQKMLVAYCATKAGLIGLTRALAVELAPKVRVNALCPGAVGTPMFEEAQATLGLDREAAYAEAGGRIPLGRVATAQEIAAGVIYLLADATGATGAALHLDGGTTMI